MGLKQDGLFSWALRLTVFALVMTQPGVQSIAHADGSAQPDVRVLATPTPLVINNYTAPPDASDLESYPKIPDACKVGDASKVGTPAYAYSLGLNAKNGLFINSDFKSGTINMIANSSGKYKSVCGSVAFPDAIGPSCCAYGFDSAMKDIALALADPTLKRDPSEKNGLDPLAQCQRDFFRGKVIAERYCDKDRKHCPNVDIPTYPGCFLSGYQDFFGGKRVCTPSVLLTFGVTVWAEAAKILGVNSISAYKNCDTPTNEASDPATMTSAGSATK